MERQKEKTIILFLMLVFGGFGVWGNIDSVYSDLKKYDGKLSDIEMYYKYREFDYFHGLWLISSGLFFVLLLVYLDVPSFSKAGRVLYTDFKKKFSKGFKNR